MDVLAEYRRRAADCGRLAKEALTEEHRQTILKIAASWRKMADQRERMSLMREKAKPAS
jgi:hypothetical protein